MSLFLLNLIKRASIFCHEKVLLKKTLHNLAFSHPVWELDTCASLATLHHRHMRPVHFIFSPFCNSSSGVVWGGGGGSCTFFLPARPKFLFFNSSIGVGVQVNTPDKIFSQERSGLAQILTKIHPKDYIVFFFWGEHSAPPPPPSSRMPMVYTFFHAKAADKTEGWYSQSWQTSLPNWMRKLILCCTECQEFTYYLCTECHFNFMKTWINKINRAINYYFFVHNKPNRVNRPVY